LECGLAKENVQEVSKLIGEGRAVLKVSVYPWGPEFEVVQKGAIGRRHGDDSENGV